jgi:hypothetical protein
MISVPKFPIFSLSSKPLSRPLRGVPSTPAFGGSSPCPARFARGPRPRRPRFCPEPSQCPTGQPERRSIRRSPLRRPGGHPLRWPIFRRPRSRAVQLPLVGPSRRPMIVFAPRFSPASPKGFGDRLANSLAESNSPVPRLRHDAEHAFVRGLNSSAIGWAGTPSIAGPALTGRAVCCFAAATASLPFSGGRRDGCGGGGWDPQSRPSGAGRNAFLPSLPLQGLRRTSDRHRPLIYGPAATGWAGWALNPRCWSAAAHRHQGPGRRRQLNGHRWRLACPRPATHRAKAHPPG